MKKERSKELSELIKDPELLQAVQEALYSGKPILGSDGGIFVELLQAMVNASLEGELSHHLAEEKQAGSKNRRNGHTKKEVKSSAGMLQIETPRDRSSSFEPTLVKKWERSLNGGLEDAILSLYAQGNSTEDIHRLLRQMYGVAYSTSAISRITERVWPEVQAWQQRSLNPCYVILYLDGMFFRVKEDGRFVERTIYSVYAVDVEGNRDVLGLYLQGKENIQDWLLVLEDLKRRGVEQVFFACIDGLPGFKKVIHQVFPQVIVQRCIVHKVRNSLRYASDKEYKALSKDLRLVYTSANRQQAARALDAFEQKWGAKGKRIAELWRKDWDDLMPFMDYSQALRRMIYTTNPVENLHRMIRKVVKSKGAWVSESALVKQLFLTLMNNPKSWKRKAFAWKAVQEQLELMFGATFSKWLQ